MHQFTSTARKIKNHHDISDQSVTPLENQPVHATVMNESIFPDPSKMYYSLVDFIF